MSAGWHTDAIATAAAVPVVVGDRVVVADRDGGLVGVDAGSGDEVWRWQAPREIEPVIAAAGDAVITSVPEQDDPRLCLVAASDGVQRWCREVGVRALGMGDLGRPLLGGNGDMVVTFALDGVARAFDADLGEPAWDVVLEQTDDVIAPSALLVAGDVAVFGTHGTSADGTGEVIALNLSDGGERWRAPFDASLGDHGFVAHGSDVVVHAAGRVASFDLETGEPRWDTTLSDAPVASYSMIAGPPGIVDDLVVVVPRVTLAIPGEGAILVGLDASSGEELWSQPEPPLVAAMARAGSYASLGPLDGSPVLVGEDLSEFDPETGDVVRTTELGLEAGQPFVAAGAGLVVVDGDGRVRRLGAHGGP